MGTARKGEIYWVSVGERETKGSEQHGRRPFVVVSSNAINLHLPLVIAVPLSSKVGKKNRQHRIFVPENEIISETGQKLQDSIALTEQSGYALHSRLPRILWLAGPPAA